MMSPSEAAATAATSVWTACPGPTQIVAVGRQAPPAPPEAWAVVELLDGTVVVAPDVGVEPDVSEEVSGAEVVGDESVAVFKSALFESALFGVVAVGRVVDVDPPDSPSGSVDVDEAVGSAVEDAVDASVEAPEESVGELSAEESSMLNSPAVDSESPPNRPHPDSAMAALNRNARKERFGTPEVDRTPPADRAFTNDQHRRDWPVGSSRTPGAP